MRGREQICRAPKSLRPDGMSQAAGGEKLLVAARWMAYAGFMVLPLDGVSRETCKPDHLCRPSGRGEWAESSSVARPVPDNRRSVPGSRG